MLRLYKPISCQYLKTLAQFSKTKIPKRSSSMKHVAIVGSGPAGFYVAQYLLKEMRNVKVDIYEKLPVPFGLVRFGVAPDHPEVKNCINQFTQTMKNPRCEFYGNVNIGSDISLSDLKKSYHSVVLAYGAAQDRFLHIPGESLKNCISARKFVGWYNGLPSEVDLDVNLNTDSVAIIGHGNVALDIARILLSKPSDLQKTDITDYCLTKLKSSKIKHVYVIGRRGPLQVSFTIKELREMTKLLDVNTIISPSDMSEAEIVLQKLERPRRRLTELMVKTSQVSRDPNNSNLDVKFYQSPLEIHSDGSGNVRGITLGINSPQGDNTNDHTNVKVTLTDKREFLQCGLVIRSIGYKSLPIDTSIPFDNTHHHIAHSAGRVLNNTGIYCSGWSGHTPAGVILTTMSGSFEVAGKIIQDLERGFPTDPMQESRLGSDAILDILVDKGIPVVTWDGWRRIDETELQLGEKEGKSRYKITSVNEMIRVAHES